MCEILAIHGLSNPKVTNAYLQVLSEKYIHGLDIPMQDIHAMYICQPSGHLPQQGPNAGLGQRLAGLLADVF
jgi:hypothetical protein